jgi:hypothetical protein
VAQAAVLITSSDPTDQSNGSGITHYVHARDPAAVVEDFDKFISACPEDIKSGQVMWEGRSVQCKRLFDALAVDWFDAPG